MSNRKKTLFKRGQSGNPKGRPKGIANKITREVKAIIHEQGPEYLNLLFHRARSELQNSKEKHFNATKIAAAFILKTIPSLKHLTVQADIRQQIIERLDAMSEAEVVEEARTVLQKYLPPNSNDE